MATSIHCCSSTITVLTCSNCCVQSKADADKPISARIHANDIDAVFDVTSACERKARRTPRYAFV